MIFYKYYIILRGGKRKYYNCIQKKRMASEVQYILFTLLYRGVAQLFSMGI